MKKILIVEDQINIRETLAEIIKLHGFDVQEAGNGEEGLSVMENFVPDLIISDLMMPKMDGFEMIRKLKLDHRLSNIPILILSAKAEIEDVQRGFELGAEDYLLKPFDVSTALEAIKKLI